ncbi:glutamate-5-semialdehyde dehydrogenase [Alteromonas pelagimontana]|uniref:Gamma-glutamyl phosphate reductase n=1 Tax=Alteromonas pelagimontana TaxID=1858656 RepID=A0A6M4MD04_9ALTE|nr:glutamate-5-semialdehyde dehydrogenase [Alteromonas pelagimontana]QJR80897.1 glutamate-5-semialdehyde dehydrogenase [Alteromonas pelagimontana]
MSFSIQQSAKAAKSAARQVAKLNAEQKKDVLMAVSKHLVSQTQNILSANALDLENASERGLDEAMVDRLTLNTERVMNIAKAVADIANQPDPVGKISAMQTMPSGIQVGKMRIPLGVIAMIYESRPNVTVDAAALCFKAGNAVILRGGKEALHSNLALAGCIHHVLKQFGLDKAAVTVVPDPDRAILTTLLTLKDDIDLVIPRGGEGLIKYVSEQSQIPVIQHYKGICHLYLDQHADADKAITILENGKTQRVGVCNALETCLVHAATADTLLPRIAEMFARHNVLVHACERALPFFKDGIQATALDWQTEYLALEIAVKVVDSYDAAVDHIVQYGSGHTEVIVTEDYQTAHRFVRDIDSAVVMVNASSRFSDGGELGLGAEIGISTSKLHAYGPMGAESLTTEKFVVMGNGEVRN